MKRFILIVVPAVFFAAVSFSGLPFMPSVDAPPPAVPVYPQNYASNLLYVTAAARHCNGITNMQALSQSDRRVLLGYWVSVARTNGIPVTGY